MTRTIRRNKPLTHTIVLPQSLIMAAQYAMAEEQRRKQLWQARQAQKRIARAGKA